MCLEGRTGQRGSFRFVKDLSLLGLLIAGSSFASDSPIQVESLSSGPVENQVTTEILTAPIADEPIAIVEEASTGSVSNMEGQYQLQLLQQEVMTLRGQIEELRYELQRGKAIQDDRYLELDRRLQGLSESASSQAVVATGAITDTEGNQVDSSQADASPEQVVVSEKLLYDSAHEHIRTRQYDLAIDGLTDVMKQVPDGTYTPNAYYWLGQVQAAKTPPDYEKARQALVQVINGFPDHSKVPDATFKLGKIYHVMGDCQRGKDLLSQVARDYRDKTAGTLAQRYLDNNIDC